MCRRVAAYPRPLPERRSPRTLYTRNHPPAVLPGGFHGQGDRRMPTLTTDDGVRLAFEETGSGTPVVFVHEFAGRPSEAGSRRCVISRAAIDASPGTPAGSPPPTSPTTPAPIRRTGPATTCWRCSTRSTSSGPTWWGSRWAASRRCTSVSPIPGGPARSWSPASVTGRNRNQRERFRSEADITARILRTEGMAAWAASLFAGSHPRAVPEQGPAWLEGIRRHARRALRGRVRAHPAGCAEGAPVGVRPRRRDEGGSPCRLSS